ncbi:hypothetical protein A2344_04770 [Candidatus Peregrinibacteria bacterium RIFOXYB12_FULL_41_12]|nr:MAG: hypothetical protein A2344_04770 [Candidatus Peregrinibacteria bacterium RIFOXYB12_FULL_41_12]
MKRNIALLGFLVFSIPVVFAFTDTDGVVQEDAIEYLYDQGVIEGYDDGTYRPSAAINRAEFTKILVESKYAGSATGDSCFSDVGSEWYANYICYAKTLGVVDGYDDGSFKPSNNINLAEALKIILGTYDVEVDLGSSDVWYEPYYNKAEELGMLEQAVDDAAKDITRGDMAQLIYNLETNSAVVDTDSDVVSLVKTVEVTPDDQYQYGAFCRVNYVADKDEFLVTFGGSSSDVQAGYDSDDMPGGAEGGNGYSYKYYSVDDFEYTDETGVLKDGGGDAASVMVDEEYYYFLSGMPSGWQINKYDLSTMEAVDSVDIELGDTEVSNDQMLAYANGYLIASSLYDAESGETDQESTDPLAGYGTHNRIYTSDLDLVDYFVLEDTPHINGSYVVYVDGVYNYITSTAYFGDLIAMQYDEDWNYLGVKDLGSYGQWAQGALYDEDTGYFYVAYIELAKFGESSYSQRGISLGIYDSDWNLVEAVEVTEPIDDDSTKEGRPAVLLYDGKLYVSYDRSTVNEDGSENPDWQCEVSIYEIN